jgi:hypothetical protein
MAGIVAINREAIRSIPKGHAVVLAKVAELMGDETPLKALQFLYLSEPESERKKMIANFRKEIAENQ